MIHQLMQEVMFRFRGNNGEQIIVYSNKIDLNSKWSIGNYDSGLGFRVSVTATGETVAAWDRNGIQVPMNEEPSAPLIDQSISDFVQNINEAVAAMLESQRLQTSTVSGILDNNGKQLSLNMQMMESIKHLHAEVSNIQNHIHGRMETTPKVREASLSGSDYRSLIGRIEQLESHASGQSSLNDIVRERIEDIETKVDMDELNEVAPMEAMELKALEAQPTAKHTREYYADGIRKAIEVNLPRTEYEAATELEQFEKDAVAFFASRQVPSPPVMKGGGTFAEQPEQEQTQAVS